MCFLGTIDVKPALAITNLNIIIVILTCIFISYALGSFFLFICATLDRCLTVI